MALGQRWLPADPAPGFGGILLAGLVAAHIRALDDDDRDELDLMLDHLEVGGRIPQPRLRHRFQTDVVGLDRSHHSLVGAGERMRLELDGHGRPIPQLLGAVYAAVQLPAAARPGVFRLLRRATTWTSHGGGDLLEFVTGHHGARARWRAFPTDERWALQVLGFGPGVAPPREHVQTRFRSLVRQAHPDHGGEAEGAGPRILELTEARRILLA